MTLPALCEVDFGSPKLGGSTAQNGRDLILAVGAEIWESRNEFHFAQTTVSDDFTLSLRVLSLHMADLYTKAGIMLRAPIGAFAPMSCC